MILSDTFPSSSSSKIYTAQFDTNTSKGTCNCPGWTKRAVRECTHTKQLAARVVQPSSTVTIIKNEPTLPSDPFQGFREPPKIKPMLASAMPEGFKLSDFANDRWIMEEKFDGHRLLLIVNEDRTVQGWSRPGHDRPAAQRDLPAHIVKATSQLHRGIYDGELYIPGGTSSDVVRLDLQDKLVLVLFDVIECNGMNVVNAPLTQRREVLELAVGVDANRVGENIYVAPQWNVDARIVELLWKAGREGVILKRKDSEYRSGWRTPDWVKVKEIGAAEFTIIGFAEGKNGPCSIFKLRHDDGRETSCKVLTNELLALVHKNPQSFLGRRVTISHMGFTKNGMWRHPVFDHFVKEV